MALDPNFLEELRARTPIAAVIGRRTKLSRSGRNWKACCPFHGEKTPSFYVYDDHFHCFGCGAHGDVISFAMQSTGQSFIEAVTALAGEAGLSMPREDRLERGRASEARTLGDVLDAAQAFFVERLRSAEGRAARDYLAGRGLSAETVAGWGLGWSGDGRGRLLQALGGQTLGGQTRETEAQGAQPITPALLARAGLMREGEAGEVRGELFFGRVTFPIRDRAGRLVSFGGRTLGDGQPKYLNGPETALFSKRLTLFGLDRARSHLRAPRPPAARGAAPEPRRELLVVEGYLDVIALHQAGLAGAVAPLGTALTAEQLQALWQLSPAPVLCFDADSAGRRAAVRAAELALPLLTPERSLRFCALPEGEDPDSLLRARGPGAMRAAIEAARPLSEMVFELLAEGSGPAPEQRAGLRQRLVEAAERIPHRALSAEYRRVLLDRFFEQGRSRGAGGAGGGRRPPVAVRSRPGPRPQPAAGEVRLERQRILTAILLRHPELLHDVEEAFCALDLPAPLRRLREGMLAWSASRHPGSADGLGTADTQPDEATAGLRQPLDSQHLMDHLRSIGLSADIEQVARDRPLPLAEQAHPSAMPADMEARWWHFFGLLNFERLEREMQEALRQWTERGDGESERRLRSLSLVCQALAAGEQVDDEGWTG